MKFNEFLAEIKNSMKQYDSVNLIDDLSVHNWVVSAMKRFGNLLTIDIEKVIDVRNKKAQLPSGFRALKLAVKCEPYSYECDDKGRDILQDYYFYKTRESKETQWDICDPCCNTEKESVIVEKLYFKNGGKAKMYYRQPQWLRLTPHIQRDACTADCPNLKIYDSPHEININDKVLYANFKEGSIYMIYKGFEEDDEGFIIIPATDQDWLFEYLSYHVKRKLIEDLLSNSDNTSNEYSLYQLYKQNELDSFANARTELKFKNMKIGLQNYAKKVKSEFNVYNFGGYRSVYRGSKIDIIAI